MNSRQNLFNHKAAKAGVTRGAYLHNRYVSPDFETLAGIDEIEIIQSTKLISVNTHGKLMRGNNCHMVSASIGLHVYELHFDGCWKEDQFSLGSGVGTFNNAYGSGCPWIGEGR
ncbi:unnamed protein product [Camellia sinensis]